MDTTLIGEQLKQIYKSHGGYLNNWVGGLMKTTVQTCYDIQYITIRLSGYMNAPTEPEFIALKMSWNISYTIHMNPWRTKEIKFI